MAKRTKIWRLSDNPWSQGADPKHHFRFSLCPLTDKACLSFSIKELYCGYIITMISVAIIAISVLKIIVLQRQLCREKESLALFLSFWHYSSILDILNIFHGIDQFLLFLLEGIWHNFCCSFSSKNKNVDIKMQCTFFLGGIILPGSCSWEDSS